MSDTYSILPATYGSEVMRSKYLEGIKSNGLSENDIGYLSCGSVIVGGNDQEYSRNRIGDIVMAMVAMCPSGQEWRLVVPGMSESGGYVRIPITASGYKYYYSQTQQKSLLWPTFFPLPMTPFTDENKAIHVESIHLGENTVIYIMEDGDCMIYLTSAGEQEMMDNKNISIEELMEDLLCNGWNMDTAENIGMALCSNNHFLLHGIYPGDDGKYPVLSGEDEIWYYEHDMIRAPESDLSEYGVVRFSRI